MKFGNHPERDSGHRQPQPVPPNYGDELNALNQLGGVNDLAKNSEVKQAASGAKGLNQDLDHFKHAKNPNQSAKALQHGVEDASKMASAAQSLSNLNDFTNDLTKPDIAKTPMEGANISKQQRDKNQTEEAEDSSNRDPYSALNGIGNLGSLAKSGKSKHPRESPKDAIKDMNQLSKDLQYPAKAKDPLKDLKAGKNLAGPAANGALGFGLLEGGKEQALADNKLDDKVANGSIRPSDLNSPLFDQQTKRKSNNSIPHDGLFGHLKRGVRHAKSKVANGMKSAVTHVTKGIMSAFHGLTGKVMAKAVATKMAVASMAVPVLVGGSAIGYVMHDSDDYQVLDDGNVCLVQNDGDQSYEGTTDEKGTGGEWTQKGTKEYKRAKELWDYCVSLGFSGPQCAAFLGNAAHEGGGFHKLDQDQIGGGGGKGIFQFTPGSIYMTDSKSDHSWSIKNQVDVLMHLFKSRFQEWYPKTKNSHDVAYCSSSFEIIIERGGIPDNDRRASMAQQAYSMFHGSSVKGNPSKVEKILGGGDQAAANDNSATAEEANNLQCKHGGDSDNANTSDIIHVAKALQGYFTYQQSRPVSRNVTKNHGTNNDIKPHSLANIDRHGTTDCTGFVWLTLKIAGYNVPADGDSTYGWFDGHFDKCAKRVPESDAKAGDVLITPAHASILMENWHGPKTKIMNEGGSSNGGVHEEPAEIAYGSTLVDLHFYRAHH